MNEFHWVLQLRPKSHKLCRIDWMSIYFLESIPVGICRLLYVFYEHEQDNHTNQQKSSKTVDWTQIPYSAQLRSL